MTGEQSERAIWQWFRDRVGMDKSGPWRIEFVGILGALNIAALLPISIGFWLYTGNPTAMFTPITWFMKWALPVFILGMVFAAFMDIAAAKRRLEC